MKRILLPLFLLLFTFSILNAQTFKPAFGGSGFQTVQSDWGNDVLISGRAPLGQVSGVGRPNGEVYISVPDTTPGFSLRIYKSTDFGATFTLFPTGIQPGGAIFPFTKMVRTGLDSIYCTFLYQDTVYIWNIESNNFGVFTTVAVYNYDITASSTGGLYMFTDQAGVNSVRRYGSSDGGVTWPNTGLVSSSGAYPKVSMSESGDTLLLLYYSTINADTLTSSFRGFRYRESAAGTLAVTGASVEIVPAGVRKEQYKSVNYGGRSWIFWTEGSSPNRVIKGRVCTDWGTSFTFGTEYTVAGGAGLDNYWFDATIYKFGSGGVDFVNYSDSTGPFYPLNYTSNTFGTPETFGPPLAVNDFSTGLAGVIPQLVEFYDAGGDAGVVYVGMDGANNRLYYDRLSAVSGIQNGNGIANTYELKQNYPNPFNPSTKINFSIPKDAFTTLKVYDIVGREVATLVSQRLTGGNYDVEFNGSNFASGVYFYQLVSNDFVSVKKMILTK
ncbi:MAG: T9SS type A sorting domain-containing protein [Ignavibacteriae bacterium]|nr:T9SS type A sorting domain-containing protein [Ignavibacteriota bacterium]MCB9244770.1 T9SS type A sorting domain-containing protein [Ignavibacteriales bacterium]